MNRVDIINHLVKKYNKKRYLEIGVESGSCLLNIKARHKTGVDPRIIITKELIKQLRWKNCNFFLKLKHQTSNDFFASNKKKFDIVLIDGLHTYRQSLSDVENAIRFLKPDGIIVMHDCKPVSESAAQFANSHQEAIIKGIVPPNGEWNGDVYKTILHIRSKYYNQAAQLDVKVFDCDYGIGVIRKGKPMELLDLSFDSIERMTYKEFVVNQANLLNLAAFTSLDEI
jgi:SAM-dependent methyltransferase